MSARLGWCSGRVNRNNTRGTQPHWVTQLSTWGNSLSNAVGFSPTEQIITSRRYVRGMELDSPGSETVRRNKTIEKYHQSNGKWDRPGADNIGVFAPEGRGTTTDPTVAWLFDVRRDQSIRIDDQRDHVEIARKVAKANGFWCVLIRKQAHERQCTYTVFGTWNMITGAGGRQRSETVPSDPHMTVYMGPTTQAAMVGGHIYVVKRRDPRTGRIVIHEMTDPVKQRSIIYSGEPVAEEFWLTSGVWVVERRR